ncbi:MAG: ABC transporter permease subunit [Actinomycetota bacterium]|nr:ABC transporter permease subunit [Actinomycetota bacterium]
MTQAEIGDFFLTDALAPAHSAPPRASTRVRRRPRWGRGAILLIVALYFIVPIYAALDFSLQNIQGQFSFSPLTQITAQPGFASAVGLSFRLSIVTLVIEMLLMVPTVIYVHLRLPRFRRVMEVITILPIVIPPIVLILGVLQAARPYQWISSSPYLLAAVYVVLAMPFVYRSLDSGLGALDLKILVEASRSLGAGWIATMWRVLIPNLRSALLSASVLTLALVFGEFTMAQLDLWTTVPVWIYNSSSTNPHVVTAVAMMFLIAMWLVLTIIVSLDRTHRRAKG